MPSWVTGALILADAGISAPSASETEWATTVAAGVSAAFDGRLADQIAAGVVTGTEPDLIVEARKIGLERFKAREAPYGVTGYVASDGTPIRTGRDPLAAALPVLRRYMSVGIG